MRPKWYGTCSDEDMPRRQASSVLELDSLGGNRKEERFFSPWRGERRRLTSTAPFVLAMEMRHLDRTPTHAFVRRFVRALCLLLGRTRQQSKNRCSAVRTRTVFGLLGNAEETRVALTALRARFFG